MQIEESSLVTPSLIRRYRRRVRSNGVPTRIRKTLSLRLNWKNYGEVKRR